MFILLTVEIILIRCIFLVIESFMMLVWLISNSKSKEIQKGAAPVDCDPAEHSSTRCELSGILAGITAVEKVTLGQARGIITVGCASSGAISFIRQ